MTAQCAESTPSGTVDTAPDLPPVVEILEEVAPDLPPEPDCIQDGDCDDGDACTVDVCNADGECETTPKVCEGLPCASAACQPDGSCALEIAPDWCVIDGACVALHTSHPEDKCSACDPATSTTDWSAKPSGMYCGGKTTETVGELQFVLRTGLFPTNKTDDKMWACLSDTDCYDLNNAEINERELGQVDHHVYNPTGLTYEAIDRVSLKVGEGSGSNAWVPICMAVIVDGDLMYCHNDLDVVMGDNVASGEVMEWIDDNPVRKSCGSCYVSPLTHGPMVGHTTSNSSTIWVRTTASFPVRVRASTSADFEDAIWSDTAHPKLSDDFTAELLLPGLQADTRYFYEVWVDGTVESKPDVTFRTAPTGPSQFRVAFGSCAKYAQQPVFNAVAASQPDILLMIGDNHYANSTDPARLSFFYRATRDILPFAAVLSETPTWAVWDDHDYTGNNTDGTVVGKENALAAFKQYWANPSYGSANWPGIWHSFQWGDVEFFMLDDRYYRGLTDTMLGTEQFTWLLNGLAASQATFKIVVSGSQFTPAGSADSWASFDDEREQILNTIMSQKINGVFLLSGDVHYAEVRRLRDKSESSYEVWEFTSSPLANSNGTCKGDGPDTQLFCNDVEDNFGLLHVDTTAADPSVTFEIRTDLNNVLHTQTILLSDLSL